MELINTLLRVLFPDYCISCSKYGSLYCTECILKSQKTGPSPIIDATYLFSYKENGIKKLIHTLKKRTDSALYTTLAELAHEHIVDILVDYESIHKIHHIIVCPISPSQERLSKLGFNQAEELSRPLAQLMNHWKPVHIPDLMFRKKGFKQASRVHKDERFKNISNAFVFNPEHISIIKNSTVIITDDVITTGATMSAAKSCLLNAGARKVFAIAIAH